jgi:ABC-type multidrug transport system fused ATPase/permease subunit
VRRIYRRYRHKVSLTYLLALLEEVFELLYPFATGIAINGLIVGDTSSIIPFVAIWAAHALTGFLRQIYDTRVFTEMYANLASEVVLDQRRRNLPSSVVVARSTLSREFVEFAEIQVPAILSGLLALFGSLAMLVTYDLRSAVYCALLVVPLVGINWWYFKRSSVLNRELNDQQEREVRILTERDERAVRRHYGLLRNWEIKLSDAEARNWGLLEIFVIALTILVFFRTTSVSVEAGTIYAIISYLRAYVESLDELPEIIQRLTRLVDIGRRVAPGASPAEELPEQSGDQLDKQP